MWIYNRAWLTLLPKNHNPHGQPFCPGNSALLVFWSVCLHFSGISLNGDPESEESREQRVGLKRKQLLRPASNLAPPIHPSVDLHKPTPKTTEQINHWRDDVWVCEWGRSISQSVAKDTPFLIRLHRDTKRQTDSIGINTGNHWDTPNEVVRAGFIDLVRLILTELMNAMNEGAGFRL